MADARHEPSEDNLEKLKQWQEARLQRKLRGEYESAAFNLAELVSSAEFVRMCSTSERIYTGQPKSRDTALGHCSPCRWC